MPVKVALPALALLVACGSPPKDEGPAPPEVTLRDVRLRSYRGSMLTAVGRSSIVSYERSSADVVSGPGTLDVLSREAASLAGHLPPATRIETQAARGNLLTRGIDVWGGVQLRTPTGLEGRTERAHLDSSTMHSTGTGHVEVTGPGGYWLQAQGFDLHLREDLYEFDQVQSRVSTL
ncbi:MAG TPA: hypothetical protein VMH40_14770 [Myxococcaceae bacterium]|nr:hypothetical protein [Myxococcaceae bacterium]